MDEEAWDEIDDGPPQDGTASFDDDDENLLEGLDPESLFEEHHDGDTAVDSSDTVKRGDVEVDLPVDSGGGVVDDAALKDAGNSSKKRRSRTKEDITFEAAFRKSHLLALLAHQVHASRVADDVELQSALRKLIPSEFREPKGSRRIPSSDGSPPVLVAPFDVIRRALEFLASLRFVPHGDAKSPLSDLALKPAQLPPDAYLDTAFQQSVARLKPLKGAGSASAGSAPAAPTGSDLLSILRAAAA